MVPLTVEMIAMMGLGSYRLGSFEAEHVWFHENNNNEGGGLFVRLYHFWLPGTWYLFFLVNEVTTLGRTDSKMH